MINKSMIFCALVLLATPARSERNIYQNSIDTIKLQSPIVYIKNKAENMPERIMKLERHGYSRDGAMTCTTAGKCLQKMTLINE